MSNAVANTALPLGKTVIAVGTTRSAAFPGTVRLFCDSGALPKAPDDNPKTERVAVVVPESTYKLLPSGLTVIAVTGSASVAVSFFDKTPGMHFVFRKRLFKPGSGVGYHEQHEDEVYYVLSGHGVMTLDDKPIEIGPGTAVLTRPGSSHGLKQTGPEDLVVLISYEIK